MFRHLQSTLWAAVVLAFTFVTAGCGQGTSNNVAGEATEQASAIPAADHSGWWCNEHGVPEEECSMCSRTAAEQFKAKGDWCDEHNRAESQCFICDPTRAEKYAALYEAKFGQKPPTPEE